MLRYTARRLATAMLLLFVLSLAAFVLLFAAGDPAVRMAGEAGTAADAARIRESLGLDRNIFVQYAEWLVRVVGGDLGNSLYFRQPVADLIAQRLSTTATLGVSAMALALILGIPLGVVAAWNEGRPVDRMILAFAAVGQAMPSFWLGLLLILWFGVGLRWFPVSGSETLLHFVLPSITLAFFALPPILRLTRSGMIDTLSQDYIRTSRAMGLSERRILFVYGLRNAIIPVVSISAAQFGAMLAGSIVVENVFALNGAGRLAWESIQRADLPTVQALVMLFALIYVVLTLCADLLNAWLDPRIRSSYGLQH